MPGGGARTPLGGSASTEMAQRLRVHLGRAGLHIVLPLGVAAFDREVVPAGGPAMGQLLEGASGAYVVGDGGPAFFAGFRRGPARATSDPLDEHTRRCVEGAVAAALAGIAGARHRIVYPFDGTGPGPSSRPLPFQRLGRAAGLPPAGPLGIQVHPRFGPWWAYRALVLLAGPSLTLEGEAPLPAPCAGCPAPCASACPGHAVAANDDFSVMRCGGHRLAGSSCTTSCAARLACPVGADQRYPADQLAFHMTASLVQIRAFAARPVSA